MLKLVLIYVPLMCIYISVVGIYIRIYTSLRAKVTVSRRNKVAREKDIGETMKFQR